MFIAKNNDLIILAKDTREELEQALKLMVYTSIEETDIDYIFYNGSYITREELLPNLKEEKLKENETIREQFLVSGVKYKEILWDSDIDQKLNILAQTSIMGDEDVITWVAMDGITSLECTKADLLAIGQLLTQMTAYVWQYKNPAIKTAIANAQKIEEVEAIEIVYDLGEINIEPDNIEVVNEL